MALVFWAVQAYRLETFNDWWWTFRFFVSCCVTQRPNNASEGKPCAVPGVQRRVTWAVKARIIRLASALTLLCACFTLSLLFLFCFVFFFLLIGTVGRATWRPCSAKSKRFSPRGERSTWTTCSSARPPGAWVSTERRLLSCSTRYI